VSFHATKLDADNFPAWLAAYNRFAPANLRMTPEQAKAKAREFAAKFVLARGR
jgi:hypothetical protein